MASFDVVAIDPTVSILLEDKEATSACFSEDGSWLAVSYNLGMIEVYKVKDGSHCFTLNQNSATKYPNVSVCFRPSGELFSTKNVLISCDVGGKVYHWHITSGKLINTIDEPGNEVFTVDHLEEGALFATAGLDAKVRVYDGLTMKLCNVLEEGNGSTTVGHTNRIFSLKWNPEDTNTVLSGGWDSTVQIWDLRVGKSVRSIFGPYLCGASIDFDGSSSRVLTGSWRETDQLQEWDYGTGNLVRTFVWPQTMNKECHIYSACYGKNVSHGFLAAGGSASNEASIFHTGSGQLVAGMYDLQKGVVCVSFDPTGKHMCIISSNQILLVHMKKYLHSFRSMVKKP